MKHEEPYDHQPLTRLTPELIQRYVQGTLPEEMIRKVEEFLAKNPFEEEAVEGLRESAGDLSHDMGELESRLAQRITQRPKPAVFFWRMAAILTLIAVAAIAYYYLTPTGQDASEIALEQEDVAPPIEQPEKEETSSVVTQPRDPSKAPTIPDTVSSGVTETQGPKDTPAGIPPAASKSSEQSGESLVSLNEDETKNTQRAPVSEAEPQTAETLGDDDRTAAVIPSELPVAVPDRVQVVVGKVTAMESGRPLAGAIISIKGTDIQTISDGNGFFHLEAPPEARSLVSSNRGYQTSEVPITERPQIDIIMQSMNESREEALLSGQAASRKKSEASEDAEAPTGANEIADDPKRPTDLPMAQAPGGYQKYLNENIRFPASALRNSIRGTVTLEFLVSENGTPYDFNIIKKLGFGCDEEAVRLVQQGPLWSPARVEGRPVPSRGVITIPFEH